MSQPPIDPRPRPRRASEDFRAAIAKAQAEGVSKDDMILRVTLDDANELKRDPAVGVDEISFQGGMRFLGVKVIGARIVRSVLEVKG
jgi:hypothetical protein